MAMHWDFAQDFCFFVSVFIKKRKPPAGGGIPIGS